MLNNVFDSAFGAAFGNAEGDDSFDWTDSFSVGKSLLSNAWNVGAAYAESQGADLGILSAFSPDSSLLTNAWRGGMWLRGRSAGEWSDASANLFGGADEGDQASSTSGPQAPSSGPEGGEDLPAFETSGGNAIDPDIVDLMRGESGYWVRPDDALNSGGPQLPPQPGEFDAALSSKATLPSQSAGWEMPSAGAEASAGAFEWSDMPTNMLLGGFGQTTGEPRAGTAGGGGAADVLSVEDVIYDSAGWLTVPLPAPALAETDAGAAAVGETVPVADFGEEEFAGLRELLQTRGLVGPGWGEMLPETILEGAEAEALAGSLGEAGELTLGAEMAGLAMAGGETLTASTAATEASALLSTGADLMGIDVSVGAVGDAAGALLGLLGLL